VEDAALAIIDADGFEALTIRRLANDLGVGQATLYTYAPTRAMLCERVVARVMIEARPRSRGADLLLYVRKATESLREALHRHPHVFRYIQANGNESDVVLGRVEHLLMALEARGVAAADAERWILRYTAFVNGFIAQELANLSAAEAFASDPGIRRRHARWARVLKRARSEAADNFATGLDALSTSCVPSSTRRLLCRIPGRSASPSVSTSARPPSSGRRKRVAPRTSATPRSCCRITSDRSSRRCPPCKRWPTPPPRCAWDRRCSTTTTSIPLCWPRRWRPWTS
jgi:AcrR family transcriptional regulator